jgi:hypothetical protein
MTLSVKDSTQDISELLIESYNKSIFTVKFIQFDIK